MSRALNLVIMLSILAGGFAFVGTLLSAPGRFSRSGYSGEVRAAAIAGEWEQVGRLSRRAIRRVPAFQEALLFWGWSEMKQNHPTGARVVWTRLRDAANREIGNGNGDPEQWYMLGWALHGLGDQAGADRAWDQLIARMGGEGNYNQACYYAVAGETELALQAWERLGAASEGVDLRWSDVDPDLDSIRGDPRFTAAREIIRQRLRAQAQARIRT